MGKAAQLGRKVLVDMYRETVTPPAPPERIRLPVERTGVAGVDNFIVAPLRKMVQIVDNFHLHLDEVAYRPATPKFAAHKLNEDHEVLVVKEARRINAATTSPSAP